MKMPKLEINFISVFLVIDRFNIANLIMIEHIYLFYNHSNETFCRSFIKKINLK